MGRRQFLTVRKRRSNERDALQEKNQEKKARILEARLIKRSYGRPSKQETEKLMDSSTYMGDQQIDDEEARENVDRRMQINNEREKQIGDKRGPQIDSDGGAQIDSKRGTQIDRAQIDRAQIDSDKGGWIDSERVVEIDSDRGGQINSERGAQIGNERRTQIENKRGAQIDSDRGGQIDSQRGAQIYNERRTQIENKRGAQIYNERRTQIENKRGAQIERAQVDHDRGGQIDSERGAQIGNERRTQIENKRGAQIDSERGTQIDRAQIDSDRGGQIDSERGAQIDNERRTQIENKRGAQIDNERRTQIENKRGAQIDSERGTQIDRAQIDLDRGEQIDSERIVQTDSEKEVQIDYDREDTDSRGFSQQIGGSYRDQSIEIAHNNDFHALAHKDFDDYTYGNGDHNDDIDWNGSVSFDVSAISNSSAANALFEPRECDVSIDVATVALDESLTCPEPANWTFSQDFPNLSDISLSSIGMDTEQACLSTGVSSAHVDAFQALQDSLQNYSTILQGWFILPNVSPNIIQLCTHETNRIGSPVISYTIEIMQNCQWCLRTPQGVVNWQTHPVLKELPAVITTTDDVKQIVETMNFSKRCPGINDEKFNLLSIKHNGKFFDRSGNNLVAYYDHYNSTIRHVSCLRICDSRQVGEQCMFCNRYQRHNLNSALATESKKCGLVSPGRTKIDSHTNFRHCNMEEKNARMINLSHTVNLHNKTIDRLKKKLDQQIQGSGMEIEEPIHNDLVSLMKEHSETVMNKHGEESFLGLFWSQQLKAASAKSSCGRRWHPLVIKWCLYLHHVSSKAYDTIRKSGIVNLPSSRTLRDYKHLEHAKIGFSLEADRQLADLLQQKDDLAKYGVVLVDEMYVKQGVVFEKSTGALFGFTDLGDVTNQLDDFEAMMKKDKTSLQRPLAKTMMVFMFKGLFTNIAMPYAHFAASSLTGADIFPLLWKVVQRLTRIGCHVLGVTCDGGSPNRRMCQLHKMPGGSRSEVVYKTTNPFSEEHQEIVFFVDPPHLIKTIRNCFQSPVRRLWCNGSSIKWQHVEDLYLRNVGKTTTAPSVSLVTKLKYEHVYLTSFSKMRVDLAAQVMSNTVAKEMRNIGGDDVQETAKFIEMVDKLFDCMNVSFLSEGKHSRKPFLNTYQKSDDFRVKFLREELLPYFDAWEASVRAREGFTPKEINLMMISKESRDGIRRSVYAFLELLQIVFEIPGVTCFLSNRICQDPLEKYFGMQRQCGATNDNPNVLQFIKNNDTLRLVGNMWFEDTHGNCRKSTSIKQSIEDTKELPLRKRKRIRRVSL